ncbi:hypothetical protein D3C78_1374780 [compost metagenome]
MSVPVAGADFTAGADDVLLAGSQVMLEVAVVLVTLRRGHQAGDVAPDQLLRVVAQQWLDGGIHAAHDTVLVDGDHAFEQMVENGADFLLLGVQIGERLAALLDALFQLAVQVA